MGNRNRLRLSELMSSGSWLYNKLPLNHPKPRSGSHSPRLKPKSKSRPPPPPPPAAAAAPLPPAPPHSNPRKSYHFGRELNPGQNVKPPWRTRRKLQADVKCSVPSSAASSASNTTAGACFLPVCRGSRRSSPGFRFDRVLTPDPVDKTTSPSSPSSSPSLLDPDLVGCDIAVGAVKLAPILTTKKKNNERKSSTANSPRVRLRTHSPRLLAAAKRTQARKVAAVRPRRTGHETNGKCRGFAVVKSSLDPWKDFRESMVEMIVENGIKDSKGLEELLACYLSLNSEEYHEVIVAVFKQIWCDLTDITFA